MEKENKISSGAKVAAVALSAAMLCGLCACGGQSKSTESASSGSSAAANANANASSGNANANANAVSSAAANANANANASAPGAPAIVERPGAIMTVLTSDGSAPAVEGFEITGVVLAGNQTEGAGADAQLKKGFRIIGLQDTFNLGEWISFYLDDDSATAMSGGKVVAVPYGAIKDYASMSTDALADKAAAEGGFAMDVDATGEQVPGGRLVGEAYVNQEAGAGYWMFIFCKDGKPAKYVVVNMASAV